MISSKEFDEKLQKINFELLEGEFQESKKFFESLDKPFKLEDVANNHPAFCFGSELRIKFPTYKIRIINNSMSYEDLEKILKGAGNFRIYDEANVVIWGTLKPVQSTAIHCLESSLDENVKTAKEVRKRLEENKIHSEICVDSGHYLIPIKVDEDNGEKYITIMK